MLDLANQLALTKVAQKPFDHAILAGILVYSSRLWNQGERGISFAEIDSDLQPWGSKGAPKDDLRKLYDDAHVWVYGDFTLHSLHAAPNLNRSYGASVATFAVHGSQQLVPPALHGPGKE